MSVCWVCAAGTAGTAGAASIAGAVLAGGISAAAAAAAVVAVAVAAAAAAVVVVVTVVPRPGHHTASKCLHIHVCFHEWTSKQRPSSFKLRSRSFYF